MNEIGELVKEFIHNTEKIDFKETGPFFDLIKLNLKVKDEKKELMIMFNIKNSLTGHFMGKKFRKKPENFEGEFYILIKKALYIQNSGGFNIDKCPCCGKKMSKATAITDYQFYCDDCNYIIIDEYGVTDEDIEHTKLKIPPDGPYSSVEKKINEYNQRKIACYEVLQLEPGASQKEINDAYYRLIKKYSKNAKNLELIDYAYDLLFDARKFDLEKKNKKTKRNKNKSNKSKDKPNKSTKKSKTSINKKEKNVKEALFYINGREAELYVYDDYVELDFTGNVIKKFVSGMGGVKRIYHHQILSIQKRDAGNALLGSIEFEVSGMSKSRRDGKNENVVHYEKEYQDEIDNIFEFINKKIIDIHKSKITPVQATNTESPLDKIEKAKKLLDIGAISQEEFDEIKNKCLKEI